MTAGRHTPGPHTPERCAAWLPGDDDPCTLECPLFKAAPEMLEALRGFVAWEALRGFVAWEAAGCPEGSIDMRTLYKLTQTARAIIRKVEGGDR